jgi:Putative auto-transporter adhesin, head GIN domain
LDNFVIPKPITMKHLFVLSLLIVSFTSCNYISRKQVHGSGNIKTETRPAGQFNSIDVSSAIDVYVKQDSVESVKVEADENLQAYIHVTNNGNVLRIHPEEGYNLHPSGHIKVYVSSPIFKTFWASGACNVYGENKINSSDILEFDLSGSCDAKMELNAPKVTADLSGACNIELKGETKEFKVGGSGSTGIKSMDLLAENVDVDISGAGDAEVYASVKLNVEVSGAGSVKYKGNAQVSQSVSGAGSVKKVE